MISSMILPMCLILGNRFRTILLKPVGNIVFFLCHIQKGWPYSRVLSLYGDNLVNNDAIVTRFVNKIRPTECCGDSFSCVQCS